MLVAVLVLVLSLVPLLVTQPLVLLSVVPLVLVQVGGGEVWGLTTGAKALFCFTAETMLAGEKEKMPEELLQLEGRLVEEAMVGLDGTTKGQGEKKEKSALLLAS